MIKPEDLKQIQRFYLKMGSATDSHFVGEYRSCFRGQGMEFEDVRQYVPGDDVRRIDWNVTARMGIPHVKEFREERELSILLAVDVSGSLHFGVKKNLSSQIAGAIAFAAMRNQDRVGLILFSDKVHTVLSSMKKNGHVWKIIREVFCFHQPKTKTTRFKPMVDTIMNIADRRSVICMISDFLAPDLEEVSTLKCRHRLHCFLVSDPLEEHLPNVGLIDIEDSESGRRRLFDSRSMGNVTLQNRKNRIQQEGLQCSVFSQQEKLIETLFQHFRVRQYR